MKTLAQNITNIFGEKGKKWLDNLPAIIQELSAHWQLTHLTPVDNMTFNYVAKAITRSNQAVVLKISCDEKSIQAEKVALQYFNGAGCVKLIDYQKNYCAMLLQQAVPGTTLKQQAVPGTESAINAYCSVMLRLHSLPLNKSHNHPHIRDWLSVIDNLNSEKIPEPILKKAIKLKNELLATMSNEIFLHGDLHQDNIVLNNNEWLAIDPKGVIGEAEFEVAAFDFCTDFSGQEDIKNIIADRINQLAKKLNLNPQRISEWMFVRLVLMAAWSIEDNNDPGWALNIAIKIN